MTPGQQLDAALDAGLLDGFHAYVRGWRIWYQDGRWSTDFVPERPHKSPFGLDEPPVVHDSLAAAADYIQRRTALLERNSA